MGILKKLFGDYSSKEIKRVDPLVDKVLSYEEEYKKLTDDELRGKTEEFKKRVQDGESLDDLLPEAFAVCREGASRVLNMRHFPVQIKGGIILHQGRISEMKTGEGKTLVATLPAYLNALSGKGVHIVTVNDYLARRDSEWMGKVYSFLGLSVGLIVNGLTTDERRTAYSADITYGTNNEMGFDYLRDNMVQYAKQKVQRKHNFAIVDEVDSILIDEARTPLIISGASGQSSDLYNQANNFVKKLHGVKLAQIDTKANLEDVAVELGADFIVDEKGKNASITKAGILKAEKTFGLENLSDPENLAISHHINIAVKAYGVMTNGVDYIVKDGEVLIVDEFTGRIMVGRRYSDGLHQAIEAKENVKIARENKTLATITFQNYFRLYEKLAGMTGTAMTEVNEFREIYSLDCVEIPTNKPLARIDNNDLIYQSELFKFKAIIELIQKCNAKGQPVLVGTVSIEKSELLSKALKKAKIKHNVLNAKHHDKEAEIVAQAGKLGAVTIATNMAGRGTDIMLGGNAEFLAKSEMLKLEYTDELIAQSTAFSETDDEEILESRKKFKELEAKYKEEIAQEAQLVREAGGLYIIGTERHDSRRIDNQLRGRAGRQGDPGESTFFLSMQDDLLRLFGGERMESVMKTLAADNDEPITMSLISKNIENAQRKVEGNNFAVRRHVLSFDDVMNKQREVIYSQRDKVLEGEDISGVIAKMIDESIADQVALCCPETANPDDWSIGMLREYYLGWLTSAEDFQEDDIDPAQVHEMLVQRAAKLQQERKDEIGNELAAEFERAMLLRNVDMKWMDHIDAMEELKRGVGLRAYGQQDPVVAFRMESYDMFDAMSDSIRDDAVRVILSAKLKQNQEVKREVVAKVSMNNSGDGTEKKKPVRKSGKIGVNEPCPCGSGKKYKKCCGKPGANK